MEPIVERIEIVGDRRLVPAEITLDFPTSRHVLWGRLVDLSIPAMDDCSSSAVGASNRLRIAAPNSYGVT